MLLLILAVSLIAGCLVTGGEEGPQILPPTNISDGIIPGEVIPGEECEPPSYSFSTLEDGTFSETTELVATVTCGAGKKMTVSLDGVEVDSATVETNATVPVKFDVVAIKDGTLKLTVDSDGETVLSRDWEVSPLGDADTSGLEYDGISFKEWRAMAVDVENEVEAGRVRAYMKRMQSRTQPSTNIIVELRDDSGGNPGGLVASVKRPITVTTLTDNWINFDFEPAPTLSPGRYWIVFKVEQTEEVKLISDVTNIHYIAIDKQAEGNDYTMEMKLSVDERTGEASETEWKELSYDRIYTIILSSG